MVFSSTIVLPKLIGAATGWVCDAGAGGVSNGDVVCGDGVLVPIGWGVLMGWALNSVVGGIGLVGEGTAKGDTGSGIDENSVCGCTGSAVDAKGETVCGSTPAEAGKVGVWKELSTCGVGGTCEPGVLPILTSSTTVGLCVGRPLINESDVGSTPGFIQNQYAGIFLMMQQLNAKLDIDKLWI